MREYSTPKVNATMKQVMNDAYREGFKVAEICNYFGFKQARVYQYLDIKRLQKEHHENLRNN